MSFNGGQQQNNATNNSNHKIISNIFLSNDSIIKHTSSFEDILDDISSMVDWYFSTACCKITDFSESDSGFLDLYSSSSWHLIN